MKASVTGREGKGVPHVPQFPPRDREEGTVGRQLRLSSPMMSGQDVLVLQQRLNALGYAVGVADGVFGPLTDTAVRAFQGDRGLVVDGIVGPATQAGLASGAPQPHPTPTGTPVATIRDPVQRALSIVGHGGQYLLGTGDYHPRQDGASIEDVPWTERDGELGSDCAGFAMCWCHRLQRHRPGFNRTPQATVSDDINTDSGIEDALGAQELFTIVTPPPLPGDLLLYKTIHLSGYPPFIVHVGLVVSPAPESWDPVHPAYETLAIAQCRGPDHRAPGVIRTDGSIWSHHDAIWGDVAERRSVILRVKAS